MIFLLFNILSNACNPLQYIIHLECYYIISSTAVISNIAHIDNM